MFEHKYNRHKPCVYLRLLLLDEDFALNIRDASGLSLGREVENSIWAKNSTTFAKLFPSLKSFRQQIAMIEYLTAAFQKRQGLFRVGHRTCRGFHV